MEIVSDCSRTMILAIRRMAAKLAICWTYGVLAVIVFYGIPYSQAGHQRAGAVNRTDVYIAGFFPYGNGVENSATGKHGMELLCE